MQLISDIMTRHVQTISPQDTIRHAAQIMDELNVGVLPVCDGERLIGMVTDRDITVRATSVGMKPDDAVIDEVMSTDVRWCFEDQSVDEVMLQMADTQLRRIPVIAHDESHRLIGIVSLGDLATKSAENNRSNQNIDQTLEKISSPSEPDRSGQRNDFQAIGNTSDGMRSETGTAAGLAGSDVMAEQMNPDIEISSTADPSDMVEVTPDDLVNKNAPGSTSLRKTAVNPDQNQPAVVRRTANAKADTISGESGDPEGIGAAGPAGASGGTAGNAGSPGTGIGAKP